MGIENLGKAKTAAFAFVLFQLFTPGPVGAQFLEAGFLGGVSNYRGDLSNNSVSLYLKETKGSFGVFASYHFNSVIALRLGGQFGVISGSDSNASSEEIRSRNLDFRSILIEGSAVGELYIPGYQPYNLTRPLSPYLFVGIAGTYFNPQTDFEGEKVSLPPLGTEGQGMPGFSARYSQLALSVPFGLGVKFAVTDKLNAGLELGLRRSFSDYLDDVSGSYVAYEQLLAGNGPLAAALGNRTGEYFGKEPVSVETGTPRGDQAKGDWYYIFGLTVSWNFLDNGLVGSRGRNTRKQGCQTF